MDRLVACVQGILLIHNRRGVTALEYGMITALIAAVSVGATSTLSDSINAIYGQVGAVFTSGPFQSNR